jgi:hypothetical protein
VIRRKVGKFHHPDLKSVGWISESPDVMFDDNDTLHAMSLTLSGRVHEASDDMIDKALIRLHVEHVKAKLRGQTETSALVQRLEGDLLAERARRGCKFES